MSDRPQEELPENKPAITRSFKDIEHIQKETGKRTTALLREILAEDRDANKSAAERWNLLLEKYDEYLDEVVQDQDQDYSEVEGDETAENQVIDKHNNRSDELVRSLSEELFRAFKEIIADNPEKLTPILDEWRSLGDRPYLDWENRDHVNVIYDCRDLLFDELGFDRSHEDLVLTAIVENLPALNNILENETIRRADRKMAS